MELNFKIADFCILREDIPQDVADRIMKYHLLVAQDARNRIQQPINVSNHSGYRPVVYELSKNRPGTSEHCYLPKSKGATDYEYTPELLADLKSNSPYSRICYYPTKGFIHCDYKYEQRGRRYFEFELENEEWKWVFKANLK